MYFLLSVNTLIKKKREILEINKSGKKGPDIKKNGNKKNNHSGFNFKFLIYFIKFLISYQCRTSKPYLK